MPADNDPAKLRLRRDLAADAQHAFRARERILHLSLRSNILHKSFGFYHCGEATWDEACEIAFIALVEAHDWMRDALARRAKRQATVPLAQLDLFPCADQTSIPF